MENIWAARQHRPYRFHFVKDFGLIVVIEGQGDANPT